ncbi:MAG: alpha-ketoglutarate-dependent dioxygenase AlkB [Pseudomonadota bacterium]
MTALAIEGAPAGLVWRPGFLSAEAQRDALGAIAEIAQAAPFVQQTAPWGKPLSVRMTSAGAVGWITDRAGYRYEPTHPETGLAWPAIPEAFLSIWRAVAPDAPREPDSCLVNWYVGSARMGLHRDDTEEDLDCPVVSISLGDPAVFRIGGLARKDRTRSITLGSGDVLAMGGPARLIYHGVDRIKGGGSSLLAENGFAEGGRINLTLRRAFRGS